MSINVTPIPRLIDLAVPAFTLGTANAAGDATTAVASNSTLLAFDTTDPAAVAASAAVGSATTAPRRDHVHPGIVGAGTVVDEAIARFDGTTGDSLQGYSSLSPTINNAGIISLTSGALKFPATAIVSSEVNTLWDYETGTFTPTVTDSSGDAAGYAGQAGRYTKVGNTVFIDVMVQTNSIGGMTAGDAVRIGGFPFPSANVTYGESSAVVGQVYGLAITAGNCVTVGIPTNVSYCLLYVWDATTGTSGLTVTQWSADGNIRFSGHYKV